MSTRRERLYAWGWAVLQALPGWLVLGGLTWAGYGWPLPLPPRWREGFLLALLLSYAGWRRRQPWNRVLLALLAWTMGSVGRLYPVPSWTLPAAVLGVLGVLAFLWAVVGPGWGRGWTGLLLWMWAVYAGLWAYGWWDRGLSGRLWYGGLGLVTFFMFWVQAWHDLVAPSAKGNTAVGDVYVAFCALFWMVYGVFSRL